MLRRAPVPNCASSRPAGLLSSSLVAVIASAQPLVATPQPAAARDTSPTVVIVPADGGNVTASGVLHLMRMHGPDVRLLREGEAESSPALAALLDADAGRRWFGEPALVRRRGGIAFLMPAAPGQSRPADQSHQDQCMAAFAEFGLPLSTPVRLDDGAAMLADAMRDLKSNAHVRQEELEWTILACAVYDGNAAAWTNRFGESVSLDLLGRELLRRPFPCGSCGGVHRLAALHALWVADRCNGVLADQTSLAIDALLRRAVELVERSQQPDGSWRLDWAAPLRAAGDPPLDLPDSEDSRFLVTGHLAEWILEADSGVVPDASFANAASAWLDHALAVRPPQGLSQETCPLAHARHATALAREWRCRFQEAAGLCVSGSLEGRQSILERGSDRRSICGLHAAYLLLRLSSFAIEFAALEQALGLPRIGHSMAEIAGVIGRNGLACTVVRCTDSEELCKLPTPAIVLSNMQLDRDGAAVGHYLVVTSVRDGSVHYVEPTTSAVLETSVATFTDKLAGFAIIPVRPKRPLGAIVASVIVLAAAIAVTRALGRRRLRVAAPLLACVAAWSVAATSVRASTSEVVCEEEWRRDDRDGANALYMLVHAYGCDVAYPDVVDAVATAGRPTSFAVLEASARVLGVEAELIRCAPGVGMRRHLPAIGLQVDPRTGGGTFSFVMDVNDESVLWVSAGRARIMNSSWSEFLAEWSGHLLTLRTPAPAGPWIQFSIAAVALFALGAGSVLARTRRSIP